VIVGGGLAGLAAAVAGVEGGFRVELFEQRKTLGGRAGSFVDPQTGETVDFCQHVAMGCCTELLDFCRRTGVDDCFERTGSLHFIGPDGGQCDVAPWPWLPAPLNFAPALLRLNFLSWGERWSILRTLHKLVKSDFGVNSRRLIASGRPGKPSETIGAWLRRHGQSASAIERFWSVVLVSALAETVDRASLAAARKVFRDAFFAPRRSGELVLPRQPLGDIFHHRLKKWLTEHGVEVHPGVAVRTIEGDGRRAGAMVLANGGRHEFDCAVVAVPWRRVRRLLTENLAAQMPALAAMERIEPAAITAVHLWFDRPITPLPHAALVGRLSQWLFAKPCGQGRHYYQVVISASHRLARRTRQQWLTDVLGELESVWPAAGEAKLLHSRVVTQPAAVFSMTPEAERLRPAQKTPLENLCFGGDWTATGWPATMEGAVRSGRMAVEELVASRQWPVQSHRCLFFTGHWPPTTDH
jgi:squalene-associated FAD-dependent desaturase